MASRPPGPLGWLRRLRGRPVAAPAPRPGLAAWRSTEQALQALEALVCEGIAHAPGTAQRREPPAHNAFGRPVHEELDAGLRGCVAVATGMTLAGLRASAFLTGEELLGVHQDLCAAAERLVPVVLHADVGAGGHAAYHALSGSGLFQVFAESGQEALDLSLVARWLAERALVPGLVAADGRCFERLQLPDAEAVRAYLGRPDEPIASPTDSQRLLFGGERSRLLRWFDPDRPVASGTLRSSGDAARARLGQRLFFWEPLPDLARQAMDELARLTGRPLSFVSRHRLDDASHVLVAQGATVQAARAAADALRRSRGWKLGVLGITWLRPFPTSEVAQALAGRKAVAVIEVVDDAFARETPLAREIEAAVGPGVRCLSATCTGLAPDPGQLVAACELLLRPDPPRRLRLDRLGSGEASGFPRRDALLQTLAGSYPELARASLPGSATVEVGAETVRSVALLGLEAELPDDAAPRLAELLADEAGPCVRGTLSRPAPGVRALVLRAAPLDFSDPGPRAAVSLLWVASADARELGDPLATVACSGTVLLAGHDPLEPGRGGLPLAWRATARSRGLRLLAVGAGLEAGLEAIRACLRGEEEALLAQGSVHELATDGPPFAGEIDRELPAVVRRIARVRPSHDSLPRFWGEQVQPRQGGAAPSFPDPMEASGVVPAGASALEPAATASRLPTLDPDACTGCGRCWSACPDSALGVTVLGTEALLTAASHLAGTEGKAADALRRAHRHLADRVVGQLAKSEPRSPSSAAWREAWSWLSGRMELPDDERPEYDSALVATVDVVGRLRPVATRPFLHEPHAQQRGSGELLVLAVDPRACLGCGLCVTVCPESALSSVERTPEQVAASQQGWRLWEALPDTAGATLARAAAHPEVGELAAVLLSRHCAQAQVGSAAGEPGSGERLAARLVTALLEHHAQRRLAGLVETLAERRATLEQRARERLAEGLTAADMGTLEQAAAEVAGEHADLSALGARLEALGTRAGFDRRAVLRLIRLAGELERQRQRLADGEDGLGRARFGVVVAPGAPAEWAARYPRHPFYAPLVLAPTAQGVELARGLARGLAAEHVALVRSLGRAAVELEDPPDRDTRLDAIAALTWDALDTEQRAACPPLLLLGDDSALLGQGFEALTRLLASDLPVKVVLLDGRGRLDAGPEPALVAMAHRRAFVVAGSLAHPEHLARGVLDALAWSGPALIHLHAPSPARHGFPADATLERARLAVEGRAHLLFRYDPAAEGHFGLRASLAGNPSLEADWGEIGFPEWAAGEARFAAHFEPTDAAGGRSLAEWLALPASEREGGSFVLEIDGQRLRVAERVGRAAAERLAIWNTLRELTGAVSPFTERIREALGQELEAEQQQALERLRAEHEAQVAEVREGGDAELLARLTDHLMSLAGYAAGDAPKGEAR